MEKEVTVSRVERFIRARAEELQFRPEDFEEEEKKVTVRLPLSTVDALDRVAGKLSLTRTACAEQLMRVAIDEANIRIMEDPYFAQLDGMDPKTVALIEDHMEAMAEQAATEPDFSKLTPSLKKVA
jgi:predicted DNA-binding protein